jgi:hypothetical protein
MKQFCLILLIAASTFAQTTNATLSGTIADPTGARVPNVQVTAQNVQTGVVLTNVTNEAGLYVFPSVQPGMYRLTAELPGFKTYVLNDITVNVSARMTINVSLELAAAQETVEVTAQESPLSASTASVGSVINGRQIQELPLPDRDTLGLVLTQAGLVGHNFAGTRIGALNVTRDGINVMDQFINSGVNSMTFASVDDIQEVRVITSPVDAELGRGSGQVELLSRSGTNQFHGSLYEFHRNTVLDANDWFNNLRGDPRDALIWNQFGGRLGGPIVRQRTFFNFTYEGQRIRNVSSVTSTTYTQQARQGIFRFFPGVQNGNANAAVPTVDLQGNPVQPPSATGGLQSPSVFGKDFNRPSFDPTGTVQKLMTFFPLPNDFRFGDGLNTAGYTWRRRTTNDFDHYNLKLDHVINDRHRLNFSFIRETYESLNGFLPQSFPGSPGGSVTSPGTFYSIGATSTLSPTMVNEFHAGAQRTYIRFNAPWELSGGRQLLPVLNGNSFLPVFGLGSDPIPTDNDPQGRIAPLYVYGDTLHIAKGKHEFKLGGEMRFASANTFSSFNVIPRVQFGVGDDLLGVTGVDSTSIAGLGANEGTAQALLLDLSGSVDNVLQAFNAAGKTNLAFQPGVTQQRTWRQREFSLFFQDDFRLKPNLTLNLGTRYEFYGVPFEANGRAAGLVGGSNGLFGISGNTWSDLYQPGIANGALTAVQLVGKNSPNPNTSLYAGDFNNFAPIVGLSWSIPYFGKDKTVLRAGYSVNYERNAFVLTDDVSGDEPGLRTQTTFTSNNSLNLTNITLPLQPVGKPLDIIPLTDRSQLALAFQNNLRTPYVQNWNLSIQRALPNDLTLDVRYVGTKGTKLLRTVNINEVNIFENGILQAFQTTRAGGTSPLLDQIFSGFNLGLGTINGGTVTASASLRAFSTTRVMLANNQVGTFADFLNTVSVNGERGALLRFAGLPENWIVGNPQFGGADFVGNFSNSTYHSLQINANKRFSSGWTLLSNYTLSRTLGDEEGSSQDLLHSYRTSRNRHFDKRLLDFNATHVFRNSGVWELPFGPNKKFFSGSNGTLSRLAGGWQIGGIFNVFSGSPIGLASGITSFNQFGYDTPTLVGALPKSTGHVRRTDNGVVYFDSLQQVQDPSIGSLTASQSLNRRSTLKAIADSTGRIIAVNPTAGSIGTLSPSYLQGPGYFRFDVNLIKKIRFRESKELVVRGDAINVLNHPVFDNPITDINSTDFGRITQTSTVSNPRIIALSMRLNF